MCPLRSRLSFRPASAVFGRSDERCPDCGLATDDAGRDGPTLIAGGDEVEYALEAWDPGDRITLRDAVAENGVAWRWESGPALVVREEDQTAVEALLDQMENPEDDTVDGPGDAAPDDEEAVAADEVAQTAMVDLFVVADRLVRNPWDGGLVDDAIRLSEVVNDSPPPFGIERPDWARMQAAAANVVASMASGEEEAVVEAAKALRDVLRDYV